MKNRPFKSKLKIKLIICGIAAVFLIAYIILASIPKAAMFMSNTVSRGYTVAVGTVTSLLPFSLFEWLLYIVILAAVAALVLLIIHLCKRRGKKALLLFMRVVNIILVVLVFYNYSVGFAYYRGMPDFGLEKEEVSDLQMSEAAEYYINDFINLAAKLERDENGYTVCPYTFKELCDKIVEEENKLGDFFYKYTPTPKGFAISPVLSYANSAGIYMGITAEANVNMLYEGTYLMPSLIAHELAHSKGVMREDYANMVSYYVLLNSKDDYLRYCGYMETFYYSLDSIYGTEQHENLSNLIPEIIGKEQFNAYLISGRYVNPFETLFDKIYDWYLHINGSEKGMGDYNDTGEIEWEEGENGEVVVTGIIYSETQKMLARLYLQNFLK